MTRAGRKKVKRWSSSGSGGGGLGELEANPNRANYRTRKAAIKRKPGEIRRGKVLGEGLKAKKTGGWCRVGRKKGKREKHPKS